MLAKTTTYRPSSCPNTSGVRLGPRGSFATNTCRPTACAGIAAEPAPNVHCSLYIVHCWIYTFSAKEKDVETGLSYFGSRYYSSDLSIWLSVDPLSDKYASLSPYVYCADNPVKLVDPNGEQVHPAGEEEYSMILNTLPVEDRAYVQLDDNGNINRELMNSHNSESGNYDRLCQLVNDDMMYDVILDDEKYIYKDKNGDLSFQTATYQKPNFYTDLFKYEPGEYALSTGEGGNLGLTLYPGATNFFNSPDDNVKIYINKNLSREGRAENFSHEGYGHAFLYCITGHDSSLSGHIPLKTNEDGNIQLKLLIETAQSETVNNLKR